MSNLLTSDLTGILQDGLAPEALAHLERDRWPEFERAMRARRTRRTRFLMSMRYGGAKPHWAWIIWECRKWEEVERVLNHYRVDYSRKAGRVVMEWPEAEIYRVGEGR